MSVMISSDKKELIVTCKCGCQDTIHIKVDEEHKDDEYFQKYGKTEDELVEYLTQKEKDWGIETIEYWEGDNGYFHLI